MQSSLGVPLEGASTMLIYMCRNMQPVVSVGCAHTCHAAAFSLIIYETGVRLDFSFSPIPSTHDRMAFPMIHSLPSEPKGVGYTDLLKFKLLAMTGKRGS